MLPESDALLFWSIAAAMTALALAFALPGLLARRPPPAGLHRAATNAAIYRSDLADLACERDDGRLTDAQHALAREDIERRLLADVAGDSADAAPAATPAATRYGAAIVIAIALPALAFGLYAIFGDPAALGAAPAVPNTAATATADGMAGFGARRDELVGHLARNPRDGRGWMLLARADFEAERYADAAASFARALAASPKIAADAGVWCEYADALGMAQGGVLAGRPQELVRRALALDAAHPKALEMAGSAAYEQQDFATAARYWRQLLALLPARSVQGRELAAAIARAERYTLVAGATPGDRR